MLLRRWGLLLNHNSSRAGRGRYFKLVADEGSRAGAGMTSRQLRQIDDDDGLAQSS
jgi:hypothetical protein